MRAQWSYGALVVLIGIGVILIKIYNLFFSPSETLASPADTGGGAFLLSWLMIAMGIVIIFIGGSMMRASNRKKRNRERRKLEKKEEPPRHINIP